MFQASKNVTFFFFILQNQRTGGQNRSRRGSTSGRRQVAGKEGRRVNTVQILCTHVCKCKTDTSPEMGRVKESCGGGESKYGIFGIHCKNFCKCHKIPPSSTSIKKKQVALSSNVSLTKRKNKIKMSYSIRLASFSAEISHARRELEYMFKVLKEQNRN
jgi:hypothetical protein